jgi:endonuclease/exonuclease/phosphatase (EEP) superfamily protein YafD
MVRVRDGTLSPLTPIAIYQPNPPMVAEPPMNPDHTDGSHPDSPTSDPAPSSPPPAAPLRSTLPGQVLCYGWCAFTLILMGLYLTIGETRAWSEVLLFFPPLVWWIVVVVPGAVLTGLAGRRPERLALAGVCLIYFMVLVEWGGLVRWWLPARTGDIRVVSFNTGSHSDWPQVLEALAPLRADILMIQESPGHRDSLTTATLPPEFSGWHILPGGDCTLLSRWPLRAVATRTVGPWSDPLLATVAIPAMDRPVLLGNVRFALPALSLFPFGREEHRRIADLHRARVDQFPGIGALLREAALAHQPAAVIWGGDINTDASARSLDPLRAAYTDAWKAAGRGWGGTVLAGFPIARIDHLYSRGAVQPVNCRAIRLPISDHRALVADYKWVPTSKSSLFLQ